jgi:hypothetical protein
VELCSPALALVGLFGFTNRLAALRLPAHLAAVPAAAVAPATDRHLGAAPGAVEESIVSVVLVVCHRPSRTLLDKAWRLGDTALVRIAPSERCPPRAREQLSQALLLFWVARSWTASGSPANYPFAR